MLYNNVTINEQSRIALRYASFNINYASSSKSKTILPKQFSNSINSSENAFHSMIKYLLMSTIRYEHFNDVWFIRTFSFTTI